MRTRELIAELQAADPTGEVECCVGNEPIIYVERQPAYYDGRLQVLVYDAQRRLVGARITGRGEKVRIATWALEEVFHDYLDLPVETDPHDRFSRDDVDRWRAEAKRVAAEVEAELRAAKPPAGTKRA